MLATSVSFIASIFTMSAGETDFPREFAYLQSSSFTAPALGHDESFLLLGLLQAENGHIEEL